MAWRDNLGRRGFVVRDAQTISPRVLTSGEFTEAEQIPQLRLYWSQDNWQAGFGGETQRRDPQRLRLGRKIDTGTPYVLQNAPETTASTVDSNPTEYVPSGLQRSGAQLWCTIGRTPYQWDYTNKQWDTKTVPVAATRLYRNGVEFETNVYAPAWADDAGSGGSYTADDQPTSYIYKAFSDAQWTLSTLDPRYCKYMAVANNKLWCGYIADIAAASTVTVQAPQFDTAASGGASANTTFTINITVGNNSNRCMVVGVAVQDGVERTPSSVTVGGSAATQIGSTVTQGNSSVSLWRYVAPSTGAINVIVTFATACDQTGGVALSLYNVQQTTPAGTAATATGNSAAPSVAVTTANGDLAVYAVMGDSADNHAAGTGETERAEVEVGAAITLSMGTEIATTTSTTLAPTIAGAITWEIAGVAIKPVEIDSSQTTITTTATPSGSFVAGDVIRIDSELLLISAVSDVTPSITVVRGYRGTVAAAHTNPITLYEVTENVHHVRSATDATNSGSWASATAIGDASSEITALVGVDTDLFVCKTDGIYRLEAAGTVTNLRPELAANQHPDNFRNAAAWNDRVYLPLGGGGLLEMDVSGSSPTYAIRDVSLDVYAPKDTSLHGRVVSITGDPTRLFLLILDSANTQYHVVKGEYITVDGSTELRWDHYSTIAYTTGTDADHAFLVAEGIPSGATIHQRVWAGIESTGSNLLPYFFPIHTTDTDWGFTNDTDGYAQTVEYDGALPQVDKSFVELDITSLNLGAGGRQFNITYRLDRAGSWLADLTDSAGNADGIADATGGQETLTFPAGTTGRILELRFAPKLTTVGTTGPQLLKFRATMQLRPDALKTLPMSLYLADHQELLNGSYGGAPKGDLTQLRTWAAQAAEVRLVTPDGTARQCVFLPGTYVETEVSKEVGRRAEFRVDFALVVAD